MKNSINITEIHVCTRSLHHHIKHTYTHHCRELLHSRESTADEGREGAGRTDIGHHLSQSLLHILPDEGAGLPTLVQEHPHNPVQVLQEKATSEP